MPTDAVGAPQPERGPARDKTESHSKVAVSLNRFTVAAWQKLHVADCLDTGWCCPQAGDMNDPLTLSYARTCDEPQAEQSGSTEACSFMLLQLLLFCMWLDWQTEESLF